MEGNIDMNSILNKEKKEEEMHTAMDIIEGQEAGSVNCENEEAIVSIRKGRKVVAQSALGLNQNQNKTLSMTSSEVFRVVISKESNESLESTLARCTDGFDSGSITKSDIANYVFQNLAKFFSDSDIKALRAVHFDEKKVLGSFLRSDSDLPEELRKAIRLHYGISEKEKKKSSRTTGEISTEADVDISRSKLISS